MKRLNFKLISNKITLIDEEINYIESNNIIKFKISEELYELNIEENILIKKNDESTIKMDFKNSKMIIKLNDINQDFYMDMTDTNIKLEDNLIEFRYTLIDQDKTTNCIIIKYI